MRIDSHHHLWDLTVRDQPWTHTRPPLHATYWLEDYRQAIAGTGIEASVLVSTIPNAPETVDLLAVAAGAGSDLIAGVVGWCDLSGPDVAGELVRLRALPGGDRLVGVRHHVLSEPDGWLARGDVRAGLAAVGAAGLAYDLLVVPRQLPDVIDAARALGSVSFVLDHLGKPPVASGELEPWRTHVTALGAVPNVAIKLSGLTGVAGPGWRVADLQRYVDVALDAFGPDRVMAGSDWPVCLEQASYQRVAEIADELCAALTPAERARVTGGTAQRWYGLPAARRATE